MKVARMSSRSQTMRSIPYVSGTVLAVNTLAAGLLAVSMLGGCTAPPRHNVLDVTAIDLPSVDANAERDSPVERLWIRARPFTTAALPEPAHSTLTFLGDDIDLTVPWGSRVQPAAPNLDPNTVYEFLVVMRWVGGHRFAAVERVRRGRRVVWRME